VDLGRLGPELRRWLPGCDLRIDPQDPGRLDEADRPDLERSLLGADDPRCRAVLSEALASMDRATRVSALLEQLRDPDRQVRTAAAEALGEIGPAAAEVVPRLLTLLGDTEADVRSLAAQALGRIGPAAPEVKQELTNLLGDPREEVRSAAREALARLTQGNP
jgi:HEAT repeat protein